MLAVCVAMGALQFTAGTPGEHPEQHARTPARMGWARLLKRVFDISIEHCLQCGGDLKISAAIEERNVIVRILTHLGLPARASPRAPARPLAPALADAGHEASPRAAGIFSKHRAIDRVPGCRYRRG